MRVDGIPAVLPSTTSAVNDNNATSPSVILPSSTSAQDPYNDLSLPRALEFKVPYIQSSTSTTNATWWNDASRNNLAHRTQIVLQNTNNQQQEVIYLYYTNNLQNKFNYNPQGSDIYPLGTVAESNSTALIATNKQLANHYMLISSHKSQTTIQTSQLNTARFKSTQTQSTSSDPTSYDIGKFHDDYIFHDTGYTAITQYRSLASSNDLASSTTTVYIYITGTTTTDYYERLLTVILNPNSNNPTAILSNVDVGGLYGSDSFSYSYSICNSGCNFPLSDLSSSDTPTDPGNNAISVTLTTYVGNWTVNTYITSSLSVSTDNLESASAYLANANYPYMMQNTGFAQKTLVLNVPRGVVYGTISLTFVNVGDPNSRDLYVYVNGQSISSSWDPYVSSGEGTYNTGSIDVTQQLIDQKSIQVTVEVTTWQGYWQVYGTLNTNTARLDPYADSSGQWTSEPTGWFSQSNNLLIPNICGHSNINAFGGIVTSFVNAIRQPTGAFDMGFAYALDNNSWNYLSSVVPGWCLSGVPTEWFNNLEVDLNLQISASSAWNSAPVNSGGYYQMVSSGGSDDHTGDGIELAQTTIDMLALISALGGEGEFATATVVTAAVLQTLVDFYNNFMGISSSSSDGLYPTGNGVYGTYASMTLSDIRAGPTGDAYITTTNTQTLLERDAKFSLLNQDYGTNEGFTMTFSFTLKAVIGYYPLSCYLACNTNYYPVTLVSFSTSIPFIVNIYQS